MRAKLWLRSIESTIDGGDLQASAAGPQLSDEEPADPKPLAGSEVSLEGLFTGCVASLDRGAHDGEPASDGRDGGGGGANLKADWVPSGDLKPYTLELRWAT